MFGNFFADFKIYKICRYTLNSLMYMVRIYRISLLHMSNDISTHHLLIPYKELVVKDPRTSLSSVKPTGEHTIITTTLWHYKVTCIT